MASIRMSLAGLGLLLAAASAVAADSDQLLLEVGAQQTYSHPKPIKRVSVVDPAVVGVTVMTSKDLLLTGKQAGATEISVWDGEKGKQPAKRFSVVVSASAAVERHRLDALGAGTLQVAPAGSGLALKGEAGSLEKHELAKQALDAGAKGPLDTSVSAFDGQVQIDIKVVEVSRQNMMRAGLFLGKNRSNSTIAISTPGNLSGIETNTGGGFTLKSASGFLPNSSAFNLVWGNGAAGLLGALSALETNGFAYTLAEPSLTTISGQTATFHAGGEYPVPIRSGAGADSTVTIRYKEYGVRVMLTPTVLDPNRITLKVSPEVSELDFTNAVQSGGVYVPGLTVRRTDTTVALGDGESFVISGLVSRNTVNSIDKFPWLGDLPIIGAFFRSNRFDRNDKELLMVVTPRMVRPIARDAKTPDLPGKAEAGYKPTFTELFFQTKRAPGEPDTGMSR